MKNLINRRSLRAFALGAAKRRAHSFSRVSEGFCQLCEAHLRQFVLGYIHRLPSKGKTIR